MQAWFILESGKAVTEDRMSLLSAFVLSKAAARVQVLFTSAYPTLVLGAPWHIRQGIPVKRCWCLKPSMIGRPSGSLLQLYCALSSRAMLRACKG